jgi:hypothetical protein
VPQKPTDEQPPFEPLAPGEQVVVSGAVELQAALEDLKSTAEVK